MGTATDSDLARQMGEIAGEIRQMNTRLGGVEQSFTSLRDRNEAEHKALLEQLGRMQRELERGLAQKASRESVRELSERVDALESAEDARQGERRGVAVLVRVAYALAGLGLSVASYLVGKGGL